MPALPKAVLIVAALFALNLRAAEVIPPKPDRYFNDYAGVISKSAALRFNEQLAQFERETSNQIVVAIFPKMQSDSDIADYGQRVAQAWGVGSKAQRNGIVLLVFIADRAMSIQVGYGLEGVLPDAIAYDIRQNHITPHFRRGDYEGGLAEGIDSICQAIRGEYKGSGQTIHEKEGRLGPAKLVPLIIFILILIFVAMAHRRRGYRYSSAGGPTVSWWPSSSGGGWSSGGSGGGFSGFSGGGGSFGGGGSSGRW